MKFKKCVFLILIFILIPNTYSFGSNKFVETCSEFSHYKEFSTAEISTVEISKHVEYSTGPENAQNK